MDRTIIITIYKNNRPYEGRKVSIQPKTTFQQILAMCSELLNIRARRVFRSNGTEIDEIQDILNDDALYITEGDDLIPQNKLGGEQASMRGTFTGMQYSEEWNIAIMGPAAVGKSCITLRYVQRKFVDLYVNTVEDIFNKIDSIDGKVCKLSILDTSGEEEFHALIQLWMRDRDGFIFVYNVANKKSLEELDTYFSTINIIFPDKEVPLILVANKIDLKREVTMEDGMMLAKKYKAEYFEVSAKTGHNVDNLFTCLVKKLRKMKDPIGGEKIIDKEKSFWDKIKDMCNLI